MRKNLTCLKNYAYTIQVQVCFNRLMLREIELFWSHPKTLFIVVLCWGGNCCMPTKGRIPLFILFLYIALKLTSFDKFQAKNVTIFLRRILPRERLSQLKVPIICRSNDHVFLTVFFNISYQFFGRRFFTNWLIQYLTLNRHNLFSFFRVIQCW